MLATDLAKHKGGSRSLHGGSTHMSEMKISNGENPADYFNDPICIDNDAQKFVVNNRTDLITVQD